MANIGTQFLKPEVGWIRFDDSDDKIVYLGKEWIKSSTGLDMLYNATGIYSGVINNSIKFVFYGTGIRIITPMFNNRSKIIEMNIDGNIENYSEYGTSPLVTDNIANFQLMVYEKVGLNKGMHSVMITNKQNTYYSLDAIDIEGEGYLVDMTKKYLLKNDNSYKTIKDNKLIELSELEITREVFETEGFIDFNTIANIKEELPINFEILQYISFGVNNPIKIKYIPIPQIVIPKKDIRVGTFKSFNSLNLICTGTKGIVKVVISTDKGITWKSYKDGNWIDINLNTNEIKLNGIIHNELINISKTKWQEIKTDTIRIAYYLEKTSITDDIAVDKLNIVGDMAGSWKKTKHATDYEYEYSSNDILAVKILTNGDYKINY